MSDDVKTLGADAAAGASAGSIDADLAPHVARAIEELEQLKLDIDCDIREAMRAEAEPEISEARLKAYEDVMGLINVRIADLRRESDGPVCGHCDQPAAIFYTTDDDVDLCEDCYESLRDEMTVRAPTKLGSGNQPAHDHSAATRRSEAPKKGSPDA